VYFKRVKKVNSDFLFTLKNHRKGLYYRLFCDFILYSRRALPPRAPLLLYFPKQGYSSLTISRYTGILPVYFIAYKLPKERQEKTSQAIMILPELLYN